MVLDVAVRVQDVDAAGVGASVLQGAAELDDQSPKYRYYLSLVDLSRGDFAPAVSRLERLLDGDPENCRYQYHLAMALVQEGEHERAMPLLDTISTMKDSQENRLIARLLLAECYRAKEEWEKAAETLKAALVMES